MITRTDVHEAARAMGIDVLLELSDLWCKDSFDINGLPSEVVDRFASRYYLALGYGVPREVVAMATAMVAAVGGARLGPCGAGEDRQGGAVGEHEQEVPVAWGWPLY